MPKLGLALVLFLLYGMLISPAHLMSMSSLRADAPASQFDLQVSAFSDADPRDETSVAVSSRDERVVVGTSKVIVGAGTSQQNQGANRVSYYFSSDGGRTWGTGIVGLETPQKTWGRMSDPSIAADLNGNFYLCALVRDNTNFDSGVYVFKSTDDGRTFAEPAPAFTDIGNSSAPKLADKCYLTVDASPTSPFKNSVYVAWVSTEPDRTVILTSHRAAGFATFSEPKTISHQGDMRGPSLATGPNGEFYVAWEGVGNPKTILFNASTDGGATFLPPDAAPGTDFVIHQFVGSLEDPNAEHRISGVSRMNSFPVIGVDRSAGPNRGMLYVAWAEAGNLQDADIFVERLTPPNGGRTTVASPVRVNDDTGGADQFFPWLSVDATTGAIEVVFYDQRDSPDGFLMNLYIARSTDAGVSFGENTKMSTLPSDPRIQANVTASNGNFIGIGDYLGLLADRGKAHALWADTRNGKQEVFYGQLDFNQSSPPPGGAPLNDGCLTPLVITSLPFQTTLDTTKATASPDDPVSCTGARDTDTVWYSITPNVSTVFAVDATASNYDTVASVYTGACGSLTAVACNDDFQTSVSQTNRSLLTFRATAGTTYVIEISGKGSGGTLQLRIGFPTISEVDYLSDGMNNDSLSVRGAGFPANGVISVQPPNTDAELLATSVVESQGDGTVTLLDATRKKLRKLFKGGKIVTVKVVPANGIGLESDPFMFKR